MANGERISIMSIRCRFNLHTPDYPKKGEEYLEYELFGKAVKCVRCGRKGYYDSKFLFIRWKQIG